MIKFLDLADINDPYMEEMSAAMDRVCRSGRYVGGEVCEKFESELADYVGAPHVVGVSNGLDALRLILKAWIELGELRPGDEVIVPANTYVASVLAIIDAGLVPVLAEPSAETLNLDTARLEEYLTPRTRAIMPVHLYGRTCWDKALVDFVNRHSLLVIEDNAQAIGAAADCNGLFGSRSTGALGHAAAFSFYPTKNLGAMGDAGAVATHDKRLADTVRALANYGSDRRYHNIYCGYNCRLDPVQAAFLSVKLPHLARVNARRRENADIYLRGVKNPAIRLPMVPMTAAECVWHQFVVLTDNRDALRKHLDDNGVATDIHYATPPHLQPAVAKLVGTPKLSTPTPLTLTERLADSVLSLPVNEAISTTQIAEVAEILNRF